MHKNMVRGVLAMAMTVAIASVSSTAMAAPSNITLPIKPTQTGAKFSTGTGQIRAKQECNSSNGQTSWYQYGYWMVRGSTSWTGTCTYITNGSQWYDITN